MTRAEEFEELRPLLFSIAYRILGSMSEAEDAVQEAFDGCQPLVYPYELRGMTFLLIPLPLTLFPSDISPGDGPARICRSNGPETVSSSPSSPAAIQDNTPENRQPPTIRMAKQGYPAGAGPTCSLAGTDGGPQGVQRSPTASPEGRGFSW